MKVDACTTWPLSRQAVGWFGELQPLTDASKHPMVRDVIETDAGIT
jgi:hypothetical protein